MVNRYADRRHRIVDRLLGTDSEGIVLGSGPNCQYFTGFRGEDDRQLLVLLSLNQDPVAISPSQYTGQVRNNTDLGRIESADANTLASVVTRLAEIADHPDRLLVDGNVDADVCLRLAERLPATDMRDATSLVRDLRLCKDHTEVDALREASEIADAVSESVRALGEKAIGMTEQELAAEIRSEVHARGGERLSFPVTVAAGPNGARPTQYRHGDREIRPGEPVVIDFGAFVDGYASDQTRTCVFFGDPPEGFQEAHEAVMAGLEAGVDAAEPGVPVATIDAAARSAVTEYDLEDRFVHATGHGVGLEAHEPPVVDANGETVLEEGVVFSVEPGVYFEDEFGVRVEDIVVVTAGGAERLNASPRTWQPLCNN